MTIKIILNQKNIKPFYSKTILDYKKRLSRFCQVQLILCKNKKEYDKFTNTANYRICINTTGNTLSSEDFATKLQMYQLNHKEIFIFFENVDVDENFTISTMSLDIELQTVLIFEQIYRSFKILSKETYHK